MSKEALAKVVQRAISDAGFRRQLSTDPAGALRGFGLTGDNTSDSNALIDPGVVEGHTVLVGYTGTGTIIPSNPADVASADASDGNVLTSADAGMPAVGAQADAWVTDEGHEPVIGYDPSHLASADSGFTSGTYSGDDIAGPSAGLSSTADAGGASPSVEPGDTPEIT